MCKYEGRSRQLLPPTTPWTSVTHRETDTWRNLDSMALRHCIDYIAPQFWACTPQVWHYISYTALTTMQSIYIKDLKCVVH